jgi:sulfatase maturation enzyme AslB (radical SAM superfamily)
LKVGLDAITKEIIEKNMKMIFKDGGYKEFESQFLEKNSKSLSCFFEGKFLGNLKEQPINEIISSERWKKIKQQMYDKEWPNECLPCKSVEDKTGFSLRKTYTEGSIDMQGWEGETLVYLEFNGSNICNLSCLHCHAGFSSRWVIESKKARKLADTYELEKKERIYGFRSIVEFDDDSRYQTTKMHVPDPELVVNNLKQLDLSQIKTINFKGGEPLLNSETTAVLKYLDSCNLLKNVTVVIVTNGTYITPEIVELLGKSKHVEFLISVDGVDELFNYIRYGDAKFTDIEPVIAQVNTLPNVSIRSSTSIMNYNAFHLVEIRDWFLALSKKYSSIVAEAGFRNTVQSPAYLSVNTLSDSTRAYLIEYYSNNNITDEFDIAINTLKNDYLGDLVHQQWVEYTDLMEAVRGNNILDIVPQLTNELKR